MRQFSTPMEFEMQLIEASDAILSNYAATFKNVKFLSENAPTFDLDYVFRPKPPYDDGRIFIFEFKYSNSPTLTDSRIFTMLARFSALQEANPETKFKTILVTNGQVHDSEKDLEGMQVISNITDLETWNYKLKAWLQREIPGLPVN